MRFVHFKCGGEIDVKKRMCLRCKKKWNPISFMTTTSEIRPMVDNRGRLVEGPTKKELRYVRPAKTYAKWADKIPVVAGFASKLPKWPRWARIVATITFIVIVVLVVFLVRRFL